MISRIKIFIFSIISFCIMFLVIEVISLYACKKILLPRGLVYDPPTITKAGYDEYKKKVDLQLGWTVTRGQGEEIDDEGSRIIPSFPDSSVNNSCVSLYGDSYTFSNRTTPDEAWSNQLSILLGCRVSNFGVSGYGTDQAYMRFQKNINDSAKIVLLNHFAGGIVRNVNQHWGTRYTDERHAFGFKPRFILDEEGKLERLPTPNYSLEEIIELQKTPRKYLKNEYFLPDGEYGSLRLKFPYTLVFLKTILFHSKFKSLYKREPVHAPYYLEDHTSGSLQLTAEIIKSFYKEAKGKGKIPIITIIPFSSDLGYYNKTKKWSYQGLLDILKIEKVEILNLGAEIVKKLEGKDHNYLYAGEGHFDADGDKLIARIIYSYLKNNNYY